MAEFSAQPEAWITEFKGALSYLAQTIERARKNLSAEARKNILQQIKNLEIEADRFNKASKDTVGNQNKNFDELKKRFAKLKAEYDALLMPPHSVVYFSRFIKEIEIGNKQKLPLIEVKSPEGVDARVLFVAKDEKGELRDYKKLAYGQQLMVSGLEISHVIEVTEEFPINGVEGAFYETLEGDREGARVVVKLGEHDTRVIVRPIHGVSTEGMEKGARVLINPETNFLIARLPDHMGSEYKFGQKPVITFDDIGGLADAKGKIGESLTCAILFPEIGERLGLPFPKGIFLKGPPGNGKTMLGEAIAHRVGVLIQERLKKDGVEAEVKSTFLPVSGASLFRKFVGEGERVIRDEIFGPARKHASPTSPVVIFIDEPEATLRRRGSSISTDANESLVNQFCTEMDGVEKLNYVIVIIATNRDDILDPAVKRRFQAEFTIPNPDPETARAIFRLYLRPTWDQVHSKYNADVYTPRDKKGKPRRDEDTGGTKKVKLKNDPAKAVEYLIEHAVRRMFDTKEPKNRFFSIKFVDGTVQEFCRGDFCSGADIKAIIDNAKLQAQSRYRKELQIKKNGDSVPLGVELEQLYEAIEERFLQKALPPNSKNFEEWLRTQGKTINGTIQEVNIPSSDILQKDGD